MDRVITHTSMARTDEVVEVLRFGPRIRDGGLGISTRQLCALT
jgi:hypothetical protein